MIRAAVLLSLGLGFATTPDPVWLFAMALAAFFLRPSWWGPKSASRVIQFTPATGQHYHYCNHCDRQWRHAGDGTRCTQHWAVRCPDCPAEGVPVARTA